MHDNHPTPKDYYNPSPPYFSYHQTYDSILYIDNEDHDLLKHYGLGVQQFEHDAVFYYHHSRHTNNGDDHYLIDGEFQLTDYHSSGHFYINFGPFTGQFYDCIVGASGYPYYAPASYRN